MASDLMLLIFEVNDLIRRLTGGDLTVAEALAKKAARLTTLAEEAGANSHLLSSLAGTA